MKQNESATKDLSRNDKGFLVTFGDGGKRFSKASNRLVREANKSRLFKSASAYHLQDLQKFDTTTENDLEFISRNETTGFGYWLWKPLLLSGLLLDLPENSKLLYLDAGCEINRNSREARMELETCWELARRQGIAVSISAYKASDYTKNDIYAALSYRPTVEEHQFAATAIFIVINQQSRDLVGEWIRLCRFEEYRLIDDSPSIRSLDPAIKENRYDQSILSALCHKEQLAPLPLVIVFGSGYWSWRRKGKNSLIWASRNTRGIPRFAWPTLLSSFGWCRFVLERSWAKVSHLRQVKWQRHGAD